MVDSASTSLSADGLRSAAWALLGSLLGTILLGAMFYDRSGWPGRLAGESTYLMQAASLAEDFDLTYTRADFDRMLLADLGNPTDLSLVSSSAGRKIAFDRPFPYALYLAPFVKIWPRQGFAIANALLLCFVSLVAARTLERQLGSWSAVWVTVLIFASVFFSYVFLATGDLFLFAVTLLAFCLVARNTSPEAGISSRSWLAAGALLAIPAATEPLYTVLVVAAYLAPAKKHRGVACSALVVGFLASLALQVGVGWWAGGGPHLLASHFRFTPETGFPLVDFTALEWKQTVRRLSALHWDGAPRFSWGVDLRLWLWDGLYLLAGRSIGLLPYFAPVLLLLPGGRLAGYRRPLLFAAAAWVIGVVILQPFNIYGGEGAVANRLFLPIYGALWMLAAPVGGNRRLLRLGLAPAIVVAIAAPFLWRLWASPWAHPIDRGSGYRHVTPLARGLLPYETSQRRMPGGPAVEHNGLMVKFLSENGWAETRRGRLVVDGDRSIELLIGSLLPLDRLRFDFGKDAPSRIEIAGGELEESILLPSGGISFRVVLGGWTRRHPMWWTPQRQSLYRLTLELPAAPDQPLDFQLYGERFEEP